MLGRLRMTTEEALRAYNGIAGSVFCKANRKPSYKDGAFKATTLEDKIRELVAEQNRGDKMLPPDSETGFSKTFVCAIPAANFAQPRLFRSYVVRENATANCKIWEAARATTAAPTFFKRISIIDANGTREDFLDGAMRFNNPTQLLLDEAFALFGDKAKLGCLVSLGTGHPGTIGLSQPDAFQKLLPSDIISVLKGVATECERLAQEMAARFIQTDNRYFRFSVTHGVGIISMEEWRKMNEIQTHTRAYLQEVAVSSSINRVVRNLRSSNEPAHGLVLLRSICQYQCFISHFSAPDKLVVFLSRCLPVFSHH